MRKILSSFLETEDTQWPAGPQGSVRPSQPVRGSNPLASTKLVLGPRTPAICVFGRSSTAFSFLSAYNMELFASSHISEPRVRRAIDPIPDWELEDSRIVSCILN